jgi:hypothetical protein
MHFFDEISEWVWTDGFTVEMTARIHYVDPITQQLRIEVNSGCS